MPADIADPLKCEMARVGTRTTSCVLAGERHGPSIANRPSSCATVFIDMPKEIERSAFSRRDSSGKSLPEGYRPWGVKWGHKLKTPGKSILRSLGSNICFHNSPFLYFFSGVLQTGDRRLIMRALPLKRSVKEKTYRADCHLWPKGTFIELHSSGSSKVAKITQRRQQSHAPSEWKGSSYPVSCEFAFLGSHSGATTC